MRPLLSVHAAFIDTDMSRGVPAQKLRPADVARLTFQALEAGQHEALIDETTRNVHAGLTARPASYLGMGA